MSGAAISIAQRQQGLPGSEGQAVQSGDAAAAAAGSITAAGGQRISRVQGLPDTAGRANPNKYLIETNPALTDLRQFMSSDYLLSNLGYNPDESWKRLGDGFYEQRLIQQAVVARTGQRFLDGQTSDEALFKYLMDNALKSQQQLNLAVGVSLTAEQVAALTHDIVWMETAEVNGEQVLVPVLYLAQANNRLAPNGALIAGSDVNLIAGQDLHNVGTLRARANLSAQVGQNLVNSGLVEAGKRLDLLAGNNLTNKAGGIIAGRDVSLTSVNGDLLNERTVTTHESSSGYRSERTDFVDSAARIEAANNLSLTAGRDVNNVGGVLKSGADTTIKAGRDVNIASAEQIVSGQRGAHRDQTITQYGSTLEAGRDLTVSAGRDISAIASQIEAKRDIALAATENLTLASAADEQHSYNKTKKVTSQEDHVSQVATTVTAGGDVTLSAGKDMALVASRVTAGDDAYLVAGEKLELLAAQDSDYSLYDMKKKGSWGSKKTQRDEVTDVKNIGSEIKTEGDLTLQSGGDQKYQAAKLESGKDLALISGGAITFEAVKDLHQENHEKSKGDLAWNSASGKGTTDETLRQTEIVAQGKLAIQAVDGLKIDIKQIDQQTVSQTIDSMVQADPNLAWLKEAEARGDVNWQLVKELHDSFKYSNSGLGVGAQLAIAIVMAAFVGPAAMGALGGAGAGTAMAAGGAAVATGAATNASISLINNKGNLGDVIKDVTSSDALKGYAISGVTAGLTTGYFDTWTGTTTDPITGKITTNLSTWKGIGQFAAKQGLQNGTSTALGKIMGQGGDLGDALQSTLFNTLAAASFNAVGDYTKDLYADGSLQKIAIHAMVGGLLAQVNGGDFRTGALAAGANEAMVDQLNTLVSGDPSLLNMSSQLVGMLAAATQQDADIDDLNTGKWVAENATQYNYLNHDQLAEAAKELRACADATCREALVARYKDLSFAQDLEAAAACSASPASCAAYSKEVANTMANLDDIYQTLGDGPTQEWEALRQSNLGFQDMLATFTAGHTSASIAEAMQQKWGLSDEETKVVAENLVLVAAGSVAATAAKKALSTLKAKSDEAAKATGAVEETAGSIKNVNPGFPEAGRTHNCVNCSIATDATLAGNPASALPIKSTDGVSITVLEKQFGTRFVSVSSADNISQKMIDIGSGARGVVYGSYGPGQPGHVFNVVNQNGTIRFLDGQTGKAADLSKFTSFKFLRTN
ncbi:DUF637 domain-containing protein [Pseudomonas sp. GM17]|uniref:DUF637 domain-containing protein n=1 Tax=Pseudomonas sp. GM17 TaxID=1144323 RepID=UPI0024E02083|nr:DUF637 domain-containing protein [Pseudomonas sp. GM17]WIE49882.1 DUF637 domain-containing protein [Pseudomonas sp. GM17]